MKSKKRSKNDKNSKIMFRYLYSALGFVVSYTVLYIVLSSIIPTKETFHMMSFPNYNNIIFIHVISIISSLLVAYYVYIKYDESDINSGDVDRKIMNILSEDEKKALNEIRKSKSISQDSLRFRLGWSKSKTSSIVTRLEKYRLIQRERIGKTYRLVPE